MYRCVFACCVPVKHNTADQLTQHTMIKKCKLVLLSHACVVRSTTDTCVKKTVNADVLIQLFMVVKVRLSFMT